MMDSAAERLPSVLFPETDRSTDVVATLMSAKAAYPDHMHVVLWDGYGSVGECPTIDCSKVGPEALTYSDIANTIYIYACEQDDIGLPFIRRIHEVGGKYIPIMVANPKMYFRLDSTARECLEAEWASQNAAGFAKWDYGPGDFIGLIQAVNIVKNLPGSYVEVGCFRGSSGCAILNYLRRTERKLDCHFLDVFSGFDYAEAQNSADAVWSNTHATEGLETIRERLQQYQTPDLRVSVHKSNIITEPLPAGIGQIAVANLDVDLHEAVLAGLRALAPRIVPGGILVVEDPGHTPLLVGALAALEIFMEEVGQKMFTRIAMDSGQTFLLRNT